VHYGFLTIMRYTNPRTHSLTGRGNFMMVSPGIKYGRVQRWMQLQRLGCVAAMHPFANYFDPKLKLLSKRWWISTGARLERCPIQFEAQDLLLQVVDVKQKVPDLRSDGIHPRLQAAAISHRR